MCHIEVYIYLYDRASDRDAENGMMTDGAVGTCILGVSQLRSADAAFESAIGVGHVRLDICQQRHSFIMTATRRQLVWLCGSVKTPPFSGSIQTAW
jgi:hypothetical protein